jgi:phosphoribosyl 1,2-cyclic phosphodiesterase/FixJ family two-component response regulator
VKTILLIDDDEVCRQPAAELLRREHWNVLEAEDGEKGIALAMQHRPDVILCDLLMPRVNGYQVCRAVREHLELRHTKVVVLTGRDYTSDRKSAEEAGADAYLVKPFDVTKLGTLLEQMRNTTERPESPAAGQPHTAEVPASGTKLRFWGVRGSIPSPGQGTVFFGGNTTCVELRIADRIIILDAGSGIRPLGLALVEEAQGRALELTLLITHTHWDHIQGFPFFVPAYDARNRIHIYGYEGALNGLRAALAGQMESPYFPVALDEMPGNLDIREQRDLEFDLDGLRVEACFTNHPGVCVAYKLHTPDGIIVFMPDNETKRGTPDAAAGTVVPDPSEALLLDFIRGADVLIIDSQYTAEEYATHVHWGHGCVDEVVRLALAGRVKRLYTFHHDPSHDDRFISAMLMHARALVEKAGSTMVVDAAREGLEITLAAGVVAAR